MKKKLLFLAFLFTSSCSLQNNTYFPLNENMTWNYHIDIIPEIEKKSVYKKISSVLKKQKIINPSTNQEIYVYPLRRENNSIYYYYNSKEGILRFGKQYNSNNIEFEKKKRYVLKYPIKKGNTWTEESKTFLILRRYPYFDYKATANFQLKNKLISLNETIKVPAGSFKKCIKIVGEGNTTFFGDSEIGTIKIKIKTQEWYAPNIGLVKAVRVEETDTDLFGTTKMVQVLDQYSK